MPRRRPRHKNEFECRKKMSSQGPVDGSDTEARARFNGEACRCNASQTVAETVHRTTWRNVEADANADTDSGEWHVSPRDAVYFTISRSMMPHVADRGSEAAETTVAHSSSGW